MPGPLAVHCRCVDDVLSKEAASRGKRTAVSFLKASPIAHVVSPQPRVAPPTRSDLAECDRRHRRPKQADSGAAPGISPGLRAHAPLNAPGRYPEQHVGQQLGGPMLRSGRNSRDTLVVRAVADGEEWKGRGRSRSPYSAHALRKQSRSGPSGQSPACRDRIGQRISDTPSASDEVLAEDTGCVREIGPPSLVEATRYGARRTDPTPYIVRPKLRMPTRQASKFARSRCVSDSLVNGEM
jgi:hypothetical protein